MGTWHPDLDTRGKVFSSLEDFLKHVQKIGKDMRMTMEKVFRDKGLKDTLHIEHISKYEYQAYGGGTGEHNLSWAQYMLSPMPGCCGVVVSHNSRIHDWYRGKGLGQYFHKQRLTLMKVLGYSCAIATVTSDNEAEKHILEKNDWKSVHSFVNSRTGNTVEIWVKDL